MTRPHFRLPPTLHQLCISVLKCYANFDMQQQYELCTYVFLLKVNTLQILYSHSQSANQDNQMIPYANNNNNATDARAQSSTNKPNQLHECWLISISYVTEFRWGIFWQNHMRCVSVIHNHKPSAANSCGFQNMAHTVDVKDWNYARYNEAVSAAYIIVIVHTVQCNLKTASLCKDNLQVSSYKMLQWRQVSHCHLLVSQNVALV